MSLIQLGDGAEALLHDGRETRLTRFLARVRFGCGALIGIGILIALVGQSTDYMLVASAGAIMCSIAFAIAVVAILLRWMLLLRRSNEKTITMPEDAE